MKPSDKHRFPDITTDKVTDLLISYCSTMEYKSVLQCKKLNKGDPAMSTFTPLRFSLIMILSLTFFGTAIAANTPKKTSDVERITIAEFQTLQSSGETVVIIDTRSSSQWQHAKDKIPGAIRVTTMEDLKKLKNEVPPDTEIVTYCT